MSCHYCVAVGATQKYMKYENMVMKLRISLHNALFLGSSHSHFRLSFFSFTLGRIDMFNLFTARGGSYALWVDAVRAAPSQSYWALVQKWKNNAVSLEMSLSQCTIMLSDCINIGRCNST
ncbi:hypothetical protein FKM82_000052 [Ascaphus truei]